MDVLFQAACIKVLVLPIGRIRTDVFRNYYSLLTKSSSVIPHSELSTEAHSPDHENNEFTTSNFREGIMKYDFCIEHDDEWMALEEFQKSKSILAVIGILHTEEIDQSGIEEMFTSFRSHIVTKFQSSLVNKCLVFSACEMDTWNLPGMVSIDIKEEIESQLRQTIVDLSITLLKAFRDMASAIELRSVIHSPPETILGYQGEPTSDFSLPPSTAALTSGALTSNPFPQGSNLISQEARLKKRASGRAQKLIADLLVLAGNLPSAVCNYLNAIESAKSQGDLLWLASSLDGLYSTLLALRKRHSAAARTAGIPENVQEWLTHAGAAEIETQFREILHFYERGEAPLLVAETGLRLTEAFMQTRERTATELAALLTLCLSRCQGLSHRFQLHFYLKASMLFELLQFPRKQAFFLMASVQLIVQILSSHCSQVVPVAQFQLMETLARLYGLLSHEHVGWDVLQMEVLDQCILLAEAVEDPSSLTLLIVKCFQRFQKMLSLDGMLEIVTRLQRSSKDSKHLESAPLRQFSFLKSIKAISLPPSLQPRKFVETTEASGVFLYSHFTKEDTHADLFFVTGEPIEFHCTLLNPFSFQVHLDAFAILTEGPEFVSDRIQLTLSEQGKLSFRISGVPSGAGTLKVIGCEFKIFGVTEQSVISPTVSIGEVKQKRGFLETIQAPTSLPKLSNVILELEVIDPLPVLQLSLPGIYHARSMLLEGQVSKTTLHLHNLSQLPISNLNLSFKELRHCPPIDESNPVEVYFHELYDLKHAFMHCETVPMHMAPGEQVTLDLELFGKAHCKEVTVVAAYSNDTQYFRQVTYEIATTLVSDLVLADFDVTMESPRTALLHFDFLNQHLVPITVTLVSPLETVIATLQPHCTKRCVLPIGLCSMSEAELLAPIPTLKPKQFVLFKQPKNVNELRERVMCFWLKEFILKQIKSTWKSYDECEGILDLSSIHVTADHIPLLWEHSVTVTLTNIESSDPPNVQIVTLTVKNKANSSQSFLIQLQPDRESIKLLGTSFYTLHLVPPNESRELILSVFNPRFETFLLLCHTTRMGDTGKLTSYCELNIGGAHVPPTCG